jgi:uncharacterized protein YbjT (DUF2867 family)
MTILITGATGTVSSAVLRSLAGTEHPPVRVLVRDPAKAPDLPGLEIAQGDLDQPGTLGEAFAGVRTLWLLTAMGPDAPHAASNALWAARRAGVSHVVRLSAIGAGHDAPTRNGRLHALSEAELRSGDFDWTIIRPHFFMQNMYGSLVGETLYGGLGDGRLAMIDAADVGAFGARVLADPAAHASRTYTITGPGSVTLHDLADAAAAVSGASVKYQPLTFAQFEQVMLDAGLRSWDAAVNTEYARAYAGGWGDYTTDDFSRVMGRPARDIAGFVRENLGDLRAR